MEIEKLLSPEVSNFIKQHKTADPKKLALKAHGKFDFPVGFLMDQIAGWQKAKKKLPYLAENEGVLFPPDLNMQQCSSEQTAVYKTSLLKYTSVLDLTGGFGVDTYFFAKQAKKTVYVERDAWLSSLVQHNFSTLGITNTTFYHGAAEAFLETTTEVFDVIYIDPARRDEQGGKVFKFVDCEPNIVALKEKLFSISDKILVKASPMIDITQGIRELEQVSKVWVISNKNECKEVLFLVEKGFEGTPKIVATEIATEKIIEVRQQEAAPFPFSVPLKYLYDPIASIHKIGNYHLFLNRHRETNEERVGSGNSPFFKLAPNTHLFTSEELINDFPGRVFEIKAVVPYNKKEVSKHLITQKANVFTRNFCDSPDQLKKKLGLKDGGDQFVIGVSDCNGGQVILVCSLLIKTPV